VGRVGAGSSYGSGVDLAPDDPWASYARTVVEVERPGAPLVVRAAPPGAVGLWPWPDAAVVHILTAWDPGDERPGVAVNRERQASLEEDLRPLATGRWRAVGVDPDSGHREEGVAVTGVSEETALELGARYRQDAIFAWTPEAWAIVACAGGRRVVLGWAVAVGATG